MRQIRGMCEEAGLTIVECTENKHVKVKVRAKDGRESIQVFAHTMGKGRAEQNRKAELRRFALGRI